MLIKSYTLSCNSLVSRPHPSHADAHPVTSLKRIWFCCVTSANKLDIMWPHYDIGWLMEQVWAMPSVMWLSHEYVRPTIWQGYLFQDYWHSKIKNLLRVYQILSSQGEGDKTIIPQLQPMITYLKARVCLRISPSCSISHFVWVIQLHLGLWDKTFNIILCMCCIISVADIITRMQY